MALAMERLIAMGLLKISPLVDTVAATSVGIVDDRHFSICATRKMQTRTWI